MLCLMVAGRVNTPHGFLLQLLWGCEAIVMPQE